MRFYELIEARVEPDKKFMSQVEDIIDDSMEEYQEYLDANNDVDDIHELEEILNQKMIKKGRSKGNNRVSSDLEALSTTV